MANYLKLTGLLLLFLCLNQRSNIQGDCSTTAREITFTFNSLTLKNNGRHLIDLTQTDLTVDKRYVDVTVYQPEVSVSPSYIQYNEGKDEQLIAKWSRYKFVTAEIETTVGESAKRYSTTCTFDSTTQICTSCVQNQGSNIKGNCSSETANQIVFTFDSMIASNMGKHSIKFTDTDNDVIEKTVFVRFINVSSTSISGQVGDSRNLNFAWDVTTDLVKAKLRHSDSSYETSCTIDVTSQQCTGTCDQSKESNIVMTACQPRKIVFTFDKLKMGNKGNHSIELEPKSGSGGLVSRFVYVNVELASNTVFCAPIVNIAVLVTAVLTIKEILAY